MLKRLVKALLPAPLTRRIVDAKQRMGAREDARRNRDRPVAEVFSEIYRDNLWGGERGEFFSGTGSAGGAAEIYVAEINRFIAANKVTSVVDIGCGDFFVGNQLNVDKYTGIDVVEDLVARNQREFGSDTKNFICMDASADGTALPEGDLCLVRQVLQHLSNSQVESILRKLGGFKYVIITEHQPAPADLDVPNIDKVHGGGTRLQFGSGLYLDKQPFNRKVQPLFAHGGDPNSTSVLDRGTIQSFLVSV